MDDIQRDLLLRHEENPLTRIQGIGDDVGDRLAFACARWPFNHHRVPGHDVGDSSELAGISLGNQHRYPLSDFGPVHLRIVPDAGRLHVLLMSTDFSCQKLTHQHRALNRLRNQIFVKLKAVEVEQSQSEKGMNLPGIDP